MLERGYNLRDPTMVFLPIYPLEALYADPRFQDLVKRMNLPPPAGAIARVRPMVQAECTLV